MENSILICVAPGSPRWSVVLLTFFAGFAIPLSAQDDFQQQREHMVETQLKGRDIRDESTLLAMEEVPRHKFVPDEFKLRAYDDSPLPIGQGQTISQPYIVAFMTQALRLQPNHKVLEIGTGSGYQAAILGQLVDSVYTIEIVPALGKAAEKTLRTLNYHNIEVKIGDGYHGWPSKAPFDAIMVTAGAEEIPQPLLEQLADGGSIVIPVGPHRGIRQLKIIQRKGNRYRERNLMAVRFVPFTRGKE